MATAPIDPAKLAAGTDPRPAKPIDPPNVIASIAPNAAPADTPRVNGVARGFRSRPWKTTPADASVAPTRAPASVRGRRATKKICASTLSMNGTDVSKARRRLTGVDPTRGAATIEARASAPKPASDRNRRARTVRLIGRGSRRRGESARRRGGLPKGGGGRPPRLRTARGSGPG